MRRLFFATLLFALGILMVGCSETNENEVDNNNEGIVEVEPPKENNDQETDKGTMDNPYVVGETAHLVYRDFWSGDVDIEWTMNEVLLGEEAYTKALDFSEENEGPKEGRKFALVNMTVKVYEVEKAPFQTSAVRFDGVSSEGIVINDLSRLDLGDDEITIEQIHKGGELTGWIPFVFEEDDENPMIVFESGESFETWFKLVE